MALEGNVIRLRPRIHICSLCGGEIGAQSSAIEPWGGFFPSAIIEEPKAREWIVPDMIPCRVPTLLAGPPKAAKSYLLLQLAISVALGRPWIGRLVQKVRSLGLFLEDEKDELSERSLKICRRYGIDPFLLGADVELNPREWLRSKLVCFPRGSDDPHWTAFGQQFWRVVQENGYQLIIVDTATRALGWPAKWSGDRASNVVTLIRSELARLNAAMIITDHTTKADPTGFAGPNTWWGAVRSAINLRLPLDPLTRERRRDKRVLSDLGGNYGSFDPIRLKWDDNLIVEDDEPEPDPATVKQQIKLAERDAAIAKLRADPMGEWVVFAHTANELPPSITMLQAGSGRCWYRRCGSQTAEELITKLTEAKIHGSVKRAQDGQ